MGSYPTSDPLLSAFAAHLAAGTLPENDLLEALRSYAVPDASEAPLLLDLLQALTDANHAGLDAFRERLHIMLRDAALAVHAGRHEGVAATESEAVLQLRKLAAQMPADDQPAAERLEKAEQILRLHRDQLLVLRLEPTPQTAEVSEKISVQIAELTQTGGVASLFQSDLRPRAALLPSAMLPTWATLNRRREEQNKALLAGAEPGEDVALDEAGLVSAIRSRTLVSPAAQPVRTQWLDLVLGMRSPAALALIPQLAQTAGERERAALLLTARFGQPQLQNWDGWADWLSEQSRLAGGWRQTCEDLCGDYAPEVALQWYATLPDASEQLLTSEQERAAQRLNTESHAADFLSRWGDSLDAVNAALLRGSAARSVAPMRTLTPVSLPTAEAQVTYVAPLPPAPPLPPAEPPKPPVPPPPSIWQEHVQPFVANNWYIVVGTAMVVLGAALLAYFTWDKHWIVRYTVLPVLLAALTNAFAGVGSWLEKQNERLRGTGVMLRGAAMALLPLNFLAIAILGRDPTVAGRSVIALGMALAYLVFFGWRLRKWCAGVHPMLAGMLPAAILAINSIIAFGPLVVPAVTLPPATTLSLFVHAGFVALAITTIVLLWRLTTEMVTEQIVPWFTGASLVVTLLQAFAWSHWITHTMPVAELYALLVLASGALALLVERRFLQLRSDGHTYGNESFVGFALILFGVMLSMLSPWLRLACFACAGVIWLIQAQRRPGTLHYWIGFTFVMLAFASVGMLPEFPRSAESNWLPYLGLMTIFAFSSIRSGARRSGLQALADAAADFQPVTIVLTVAVAVLSQWHFRSAPLPTGLVIIACAAIMAWRARQTDRLAWLHSAMAMAAVALPYLGCVDVLGRNLHGNTLVFGLGVLSILWLMFIRFKPEPIFLQARSTVLWIYGGLGLTAMVVRVLLEQGTPGDLVASRVLLDFVGPFLMAAALVATAYHSRSLVPSAMAVAIVVVLLPELRLQIQRLLPGFEWGSGLGSGIGAVLLAATCFPVARSRRLQNLEGGDLFLGQHLFPLTRRDASLFLIPLCAGAVYLATRVDFWLAPVQFLRHSIDWKTISGTGLSYVAWTLLAILLCSKMRVGVLVAVSWIAAFECFFLQESRQADPQWQMPILFTGLLIQLTWFVSNGLRERLPHIDRAFSPPATTTLDIGSIFVAAGCTVWMLLGLKVGSISYLMVFAAAELMWHGDRHRRVLNGWLLLVLGLVYLAAATNPGTGMLPDRFELARSFNGLLWSALAVQLVILALEFRRDWMERLRWLRLPFQSGSIAVMVALATYLVKLLVEVTDYSPPLLSGLLLPAGLLLAARAVGSTALLLIPVGFAYVWVLSGKWTGFTTQQRVSDLFRPIHLGAFALGFTLLIEVGTRLYAIAPRLMSARIPANRVFGSRLWLEGCAAICAAGAVLLHSMAPAWRGHNIELTGAYLGAAAFVVWSFVDFAPAMVGVAAAALTLPNVTLVDKLAGHRLDTWGMSDIHLLCIGIVLTLLQGTVLRLVMRRPEMIRAMRNTSMVLAGLVLVLLGFHYFAHPDLTQISTPRFAVSGVLSILAALYFRRVARQTGDTEALRSTCEALYHYGVTVAVWCFALMVPALRSPYTALFALGIPVLYFYGRAETGLRLHSLNDPVARQYRTSAAALCFLLLGMYVFRPAMQMVLFPTLPLRLDHYHFNSPIVLAVGLILLRLHGLGAHDWLAFYGGVALMIGAYFGITTFRELSPFHTPVGAAWTAAAFAHFLIVATYQRSPLRSIVQKFAQISDDLWARLRHSWGHVLLITSQLVIGAALVDCFKGASSSYQFAPLLLAAASVFVHLAVAGAYRIYFVVAGLLVLLALHADFLLPSYLPKRRVIWVLLAAWAAGIIFYEQARQRVMELRIGPAFFSLFALCVAHVAYHGFDSHIGLGATWAMLLLSALTPTHGTQAQLPEEKFAASTWPLFIPWLVFFTEKPAGYDVREMLWPALATFAVVELLALLFRFRGAAITARITSMTATRPRVITQSVNMFNLHQARVQTVLAFGGFVGATFVMVAHYRTAYTSSELVALCVIFAVCAVSLFFEGRARASAALYVIAQLSLVGMFAALRRQLILTIGWWNYEYDVWAALLISCGIAGMKQQLREHAPGMSKSMTGTLFALPVVTIAWVLIHHLKTDVALVVMGLYSLIFAFLGRGEKNSAYNLVAIAGFVAFVVTLFWGRLGLHTMHAYILPVGCGILAMVQMFRRDLTPQLRNQIQFVTIAAMLGTSGFYAFADARHPVGFNLTMLVLCLAAMGLGSLLRIRIYLFLGAAALILDLASLAYKLVMRFDSTYRMSTIGALLLGLGGVLVAASVHYKAHQDKWEGALDRVRQRFNSWS